MRKHEGGPAIKQVRLRPVCPDAALSRLLRPWIQSVEGGKADAHFPKERRDGQKGNRRGKGDATDADQWGCAGVAPRQDQRPQSNDAILAEMAHGLQSKALHISVRGACALFFSPTGPRPN